MDRRTKVTIDGEQFRINGEPTYKGREWKGHKIEGLLLNSRMVQGVFDDMNPETQHLWNYPDTRTWDANRNTNEFITAMPTWLAHGLLAFTINLQGGNPFGYSKAQPWYNSALTPNGGLYPTYMERLERILDRADELGMIVILGCYYFGQEIRLNDEAAFFKGVENTLDWLFDKGYENVIIEINNECDVPVYQQPVMRSEGIHRLIEHARDYTRDGKRKLVGTSYKGNSIPSPKVVTASDFILLHGNGVSDPARIQEMVEQTRQVEGYHPMPILFNEDDHFDFDAPMNNMIAAISKYASWGFFDYRMDSTASVNYQNVPSTSARKGEGFDDGYQSIPVNWGISSERKRGFFNLLREITGY